MRPIFSRAILAGAFAALTACGDDDGVAASALPADTIAASARLEPVTAALSAVDPAANECASPRAGWIWCDDFEADRTPRYFEYASDGGAFVRGTGAGVAGSTGMRARWTAGATDAGNLKLAFGRTPSSYMKPVDAGTANYREVYWRLYVRNQPGWTGGGADKLTRGIVFANANWAEAAIGHVWSGGSGSTYLVADPASGTDAAGTLKTTKYNDFANLRWLGAGQSTTPIFSSANVGQWYCVETRMKLNDAGQSNGVFELWINGTKEVSRTGLNWLGSFNSYGINALFIENYWNAGSPTTQERYFDNLVVSTQPIGCQAPVASVVITPDSASVEVGTSRQYAATLRDASGAELTGRSVLWRSSDSTVAHVSATGLVTGRAVGRATITASSEGRNDQAVAVIVAPAKAPVASVTVSPASTSLEVGATRQLSATLRDASGNALSGRAVTWISSNTAVATVSTTGLVSAVGTGSATITATSEGKSGTATIAVSQPAVASIQVTPDSAAIATGGSQRFIATLRDARGNVLSGRSVTWRSSRTRIATVGSDGLVRGVRTGTAIIMASADEATGDATVTVGQSAPSPVATVAVTLDASTVRVGQTTQATATLRDANGNVLTGRTITWSSSNSSVATVSGSGLVTARAAGTAQITATSEGKSGSAALTVASSSPPPSGSYTPMASDRFSQYTSTSQLLANKGSGKPYCEFLGSSRIALDASVTYSGHQTVRVDQPAGTNGISRLTTCFSSQNFWFRIKLRFSNGWTTAGSITSANSFKMFGWWWGEGAGRGDLEITNTTQYQLHFDPQFSGKPFVSVNAGSVTTEWSDGGWYDYIIHYQVSGTATRTRWWLAKDGQTPALKATANGIPAATAQGVGFPFYFNQTPRANQSLWIGQWEVVDGSKHASPWGL